MGWGRGWSGEGRPELGQAKRWVLLGSALSMGLHQDGLSLPCSAAFPLGVRSQCTSLTADAQVTLLSELFPLELWRFWFHVSDNVFPSGFLSLSYFYPFCSFIFPIVGTFWVLPGPFQHGIACFCPPGSPGSMCSPWSLYCSQCPSGLSIYDNELLQFS